MNEYGAKVNLQRNKHRPLIKDKLNEIARNDPKRSERQAQWDSMNAERKMYLSAKRRAKTKNPLQYYSRRYHHTGQMFSVTYSN